MRTIAIVVVMLLGAGAARAQGTGSGASPAQGTGSGASPAKTATPAAASPPAAAATPTTAGSTPRPASPPPPPAIRHEPINETQAGALALRFFVRDPDRLGRLVVRWIGEAEGSGLGEAPVLRGEDGYAARLPESAVQPPAVRYWAVERTPDGGERPVFASAAAPHRVLVFHDEATRIEHERLDRRGGNRSSLLASGEYVDFGSRRLVANGEKLPDRYYRLEAGYAYAFLTTVEEVQLSLVRVRGEAGRTQRTADPMTGRVVERAVTPEVGTDYGRALVTLQPIEWLRLRGTVLLGASQKGFEYGGGGALVLGDPMAVNLAISSEALTTLGVMSALRMGFLAAEGWPMGATVEVSNFPVGDDSGVRLLYDIGYEIAPGSLVVLRGGYQARTSVTGGPAIALGVRYAF